MDISKELNANARELLVEDSTEEGPWICFLTLVRCYPSDMSYLEKRLVLKLDLLILTFCCLSFFTKYLDQQAITNIYVS